MVGPVRYPARAVPVRLLHVRLLAAALCIAWIVVAVTVIVAYHPGGPVDALVAATAVAPVIVAATALVWPPRFSDRRVGLAVMWMGIVSVLLVVPSVVLLLQTLAAGGRQTLLPSPETAYAAALALATTCAFAGLGYVSARGGAAGAGGPAGRRDASSRVIRGTALGLVMTFVVAAAFGGAALANETALRASLQDASPFGPNDPALVLPPCTELPREAAYARVHISAEGRLDSALIGSVTLDGVRAREAERWTAQRATPFSAGPLGFTRVGPRAWSRRGGGQWDEVSREVFGPAPSGTLDRAVRALVSGPGRAAAEDLGQELIGGARSRHCRFAVDGPTALEAFVPLRWLASATPPTAPLIAEWRGELDYWLFADGQLGMVRVMVSGYPPAGWPGFGLTGTLSATLTATDRTEPVTVEQPLP